MVLVYIGLGGNLGDPVAQIREGLGGLKQLSRSRVVRRSSLYRSAPIGPQNQPDFVNAVACLDTELAPQDLLAALQAMETRQGRVRRALRWGPRTLDLDILLYGDLRMAEPLLTIPHPRMAERAFVLLPLREIATGIVVPGAGKVDDLIDRLPPQAVHPLPGE